MNLTEAKAIAAGIKEEVVHADLLMANAKDSHEKYQKAINALGEKHPETKKLKTSHEAHSKAFHDHVAKATENEMKDAEHNRMIQTISAVADGEAKIKHGFAPAQNNQIK
jgi:RNA polymerase-binding transcription factor DksA